MRWYYIGSTNNLNRRVEEHKRKRVRSTIVHVPLFLVWNKEFTTEKEARSYERKLKNKRIEKETLIKSLQK